MFGTGVKGLNFTGPTVADMLRLNYSIPVTPAGKVNRLGVIGGDNGGFPNGRRLGDDVVDIAEQVMAGFLKGNKVPLGDGVNSGDVPALGFFPYQADPAVRLRQHEGSAEALTRRDGRARCGGPSLAAEETDETSRRHHDRRSPSPPPRCSAARSARPPPLLRRRPRRSAPRPAASSSSSRRA